MALLINKIIHDEHPNAKHDIGLRIMDELMKTIAPFITDKPVEGDVREDAIEIVDNELIKQLHSSIRANRGNKIVDALLSKYNFTPKG